MLCNFVCIFKYDLIIISIIYQNIIKKKIYNHIKTHKICEKYFKKSYNKKTNTRYG